MAYDLYTINLISKIILDNKTYGIEVLNTKKKR